MEKTSKYNPIKYDFYEHSYISGIIYLNDSELYINYFHVNPDHRGKGFGSKLLNKVIDVSKEKYNISHVCLDDESAHYRKPRNIYIKFVKYYNIIR